ncbi:MAG: XrtB/PEP-CTERM-associated polysaccharide biosynthesis outer membrane protein EpsL [Pseudomonadota bacterium]
MRNFGLNRKLLNCLPSILLLICFQGVSLSAMAAIENTFSPFVAGAKTYDSNLLRLDYSAGAANASDYVRRTVVGVNTDWKIARQHILLNASVNENYYDRYSMLNYQGRDLKAGWNWQLGNRLSGDLGYTNKVTIGSFDYQQSLLSNLYTQTQYFWDGLWLFHPSWQVGMGVSKNNISYSDINQQSQNREDDLWEATLQYLSSTTSKIGIKQRETKGNYPNLAINSPALLDNGYHQHEMLGTIDWMYSGSSQLHGQGGVVQRRHDHFSSRDYNTLTARGDYTWLPSATVSVNASAWREIAPYDDVTSSYSVSRGVSVASVWMATSKITASARWQHDRRRFLGDPGIQQLTAARVDSYDTFRLGIGYHPSRTINFNLTVGEDTRVSNQRLAGFTSKMISIFAIFKM